MFATYLKIASRVLWRNKIYVIFNIGGLGFAIACAFLAYLNFNYHFKFDSNYSRTEQVYRINSMRTIEGSKQPWGIIPAPLAQVVQKKISGVEQVIRLSSEGIAVKHLESTFGERIHYAGRSLFDCFSIPLVSGNLGSFDQPDQIVISEDFAEKCFNKQLAVGKSLTIIGSDGKAKLYTVAAVARRIPANSSIQFDLLTSFKNKYSTTPAALTDWQNASSITTFVKLKDKQTPGMLAGLLNSYVQVYNENNKDKQVDHFYLQPFSELAVSSDIDMPGYVYGSQLEPNPRGVLVIVPAIMSLFVLIITCFNFTNVSIAFASSRLKEIGIRKVIGGRKPQLIMQFLTENLVLCVLALFTATAFVGILLPSIT